jgi:hypothetical protein
MDCADLHHQRHRLRDGGAPLQQIEVTRAGLGMAADHGHVVRRRDGPGRRQVRQRVRRAEDARDGLSGQKAGVAAAHAYLDGCRSARGGQGCSALAA